MSLVPPLPRRNVWPWKHVWATALVVGALLGIQPIIPYLIGGRNVDLYTQSGPALLSVLLWACLSPVIFSLSSTWIEQRGLGRGLRLVAISLVAGVVHAFVSLALFGLPYLVGGDVVLNRHAGVLLAVKTMQSWLEFWAIFFLLYSIELDRRHRRQRMELVIQQRDLFQARLASLQMQLQPHFIFNALNAVAAEMDEDRASAQDMVAAVGSLLGHMLKTASRQWSTLAEERTYIDAYLKFASIPFQAPIPVQWECTSQALSAQVPHMVLQPLVENAIKHGGFARDQVGWIKIQASVDQQQLDLRLTNQLIGAERSGRGTGVGLDNTKRRLALLYPEGHGFSAREEDGDHFVVELCLPLRPREVGE